ncbi:MAG: transglycosylase domain-containing protein, partial [Pseudomonadota bacterium]
MAAKPPNRKSIVAERRGTSSVPKRARSGRGGREKLSPFAQLMALPGRILRFIARAIFAISWRSAMVLALGVGTGVLYVVSQLPEVEDLVDGRARGSVTMLDRSGAVYAWRGDQYGGFIRASQVSEHLRNAIVATEDKRYYWHFGISPRGVASAVRINLQEGRGPLSGHGGSTLTQQTAKLLCLGVPFDTEVWSSEADYEADCRRTTLWRKIKEAIYAVALETKYTKDEILTIYLNRAFLGAGARGFEAASLRYFGKSAAQLEPSEAAMLAGLLVAPTRFAPTNNLERSRERAVTVLRLMHEQGYLTEEERIGALARPATLSKAAERHAGGYFADWVMASGPDFFTRSTTEDVLIRTTLDQRIQAAAEAAVADIFATRVREGSEAEAAVVVMDADGAVRAMVGGRSTRVTGAFNRATQAKRQTGSIFKPFVYATALELGAHPWDPVLDAELCMNVPGSGRW